MDLCLNVTVKFIHFNAVIGVASISAITEGTPGTLTIPNSALTVCESDF